MGFKDKLKYSASQSNELKLNELIRASKKEITEQDMIWSEEAIQTVLKFAEKSIKEDPSKNIGDIINEITDDVEHYVSSFQQVTTKSNIIEYYIGEKLYEMKSEYSFEKIYKETKDDINNKKINLENCDYNKLKYTANLKENMKLLIACLIKEYRDEQKQLLEYRKKDPELDKALDALSGMSNKVLERQIRSFSREERDAFRNLVKASKLTERKSVEDNIREITEESRKNIKNEIIKSINMCVNLIDKYGYMEKYVKAANNVNKGMIYISSWEYDYEETKKLLSPESLKKLNVEQLVALNAFWTNRANKVINQLNKSTYILSQRNLVSLRETKPGVCEIFVDDEKRRNALVKLGTLEKLCFEAFEEVDAQREHGQNRYNFGIKIRELSDKYGSAYKKYFDGVLPPKLDEIDDEEHKKMAEAVTNDLANDLCDCYLFENAVFNSYRIKDCNLEALMVSILNGKSDKILNYGYIPEDDKDLKNKKFVLIGIDIKGLNMPVRLHFRRDKLVESISQMNNENSEDTEIKLKKYKGYKDFIAYGRYIPTKILVPLNNRMTKVISDKIKQYRSSKSGVIGKPLLHVSFLSNPQKDYKFMEEPDEYVVLDDGLKLQHESY